MIARLLAVLHHHHFEKSSWVWDMEEGTYWIELCRCGQRRKDYSPTVKPRGWTAP